MQAALSTLRDVQGVLGSFVVDQEGAVLARDMPAMVDDGALAGAGRRVMRMALAIEQLGKKPDQCSLRFGSFLLVARSAEPLTLCVLLSGTSNVTALHMGTTLVARRLLAEHREAQARVRLEQLGQQSQPPPRPAQASLPPPKPGIFSAFSSPPPAPSRPAPSSSAITPKVGIPRAPGAPQGAAPEEIDAPSPTRIFRGRPV
jgi:predicted regulator of Ras-like GTPase activity (Roadblock/LC7/MglB family)